MWRTNELREPADGHRSVAAYFWLDGSAYQRARAELVDGDLWPTDYETWRREADSAIGRLTVDGARPRKVAIDLDQFFAWCRENGLPTDAGARLAFAEIAARSSADADSG